MSLPLHEKETVHWYQTQSRRIISWINFTKKNYPIHVQPLSEVVVIQPDDTLSQMEKGELPAIPTLPVTMNGSKKEYAISQFEGKMYKLVKRRTKVGTMPYLTLDQWKEEHYDAFQTVYNTPMVIPSELQPFLAFSLQEKTEPVDEKEKKKKRTWAQLNDKEKYEQWTIFLLRLAHFLPTPIIDIDVNGEFVQLMKCPISSWESHIVWDRVHQSIIHYKKAWWNYETNQWVLECIDEKVQDAKKKVKALFK